VRAAGAQVATSEGPAPRRILGVLRQLGELSEARASFRGCPFVQQRDAELSGGSPAPGGDDQDGDSRSGGCRRSRSRCARFWHVAGAHAGAATRHHGSKAPLRSRFVRVVATEGGRVGKSGSLRVAQSSGSENAMRRSGHLWMPAGVLQQRARRDKLGACRSALSRTLGRCI